MSNGYFERWAEQQGLQVFSVETLVRGDVAGEQTYALVTVGDAQSGGEALFRLQEGKQPELVAEDNAIDLSLNGFPNSSGVGDHSIRTLDREFAGIAAPHFPEGSTSRQRLHIASLHYVGKLSSREVPETKNGRRACAWAVNVVAKAALGRPVGGGLSTEKMYQVLLQDATWKRVAKDGAPNDGDLIISPTGGADKPARGIGHVGIIDSGGAIRSNSSGQGIWLQNYSLEEWAHRYRELGVVLFRHDD